MLARNVIQVCAETYLWSEEFIETEKSLNFLS